MSDQRELTVSVNQACEIVGVSRRTIYNWLHLGKLRAKRTAGGCLRIYEESLWRDRTPKVVPQLEPQLDPPLPSTWGELGKACASPQKP